MANLPRSSASHPSPQFHQAITGRRQGATGILDKLQTLLVAILHAACLTCFCGEKKLAVACGWLIPPDL